MGLASVITKSFHHYYWNFKKKLFYRLGLLSHGFTPTTGLVYPFTITTPPSEHFTHLCHCKQGKQPYHPCLYSRYPFPHWVDE